MKMVKSVSTFVRMNDEDSGDEIKTHFSLFVYLQGYLRPFRFILLTDYKV